MRLLQAGTEAETAGETASETAAETAAATAAETVGGAAAVTVAGAAAWRTTAVRRGAATPSSTRPCFCSTAAWNMWKS
jgi:hypothetical protein